MSIMSEHSNKKPGYVLGVDIGGSHISSALVGENGDVLEGSFTRKRVSSKSANSKLILQQWVDVLKEFLSTLGNCPLKAIGIAMPGPFDYVNGISLINGVDKYHALFGINIRSAIQTQLGVKDIPIVFENDASCFGIGESLIEGSASDRKIIALTLGTGLGATFLDKGTLMKEGKSVPAGGVLFNIPFKEGLAEDYISTRGIVKAYGNISGIKVTEVKEIAERATIGKEAAAIEVFEFFADNIAACLSPWIKAFEADCLIIGGSIANASPLFLPRLLKVLHEEEGIGIDIKISNKMEMSAIAGAADLVKKVDNLTLIINC